jgi:DivIVA domain-containing protein
MGPMDASQTALDSLRTVEFRETLKGYHRDDVDEYLEKAAVEAEGLQEQLRQSGERLRQAAERIAQLETALEHKPEPEQVVVTAPAEPDDTLQRTLVLAQKFVDETKADAEAQASRLVAEADAKARQITEQAQTEANRTAAESEQRLREEIDRLEGSRSKLARDVETMTRHLESERARLRGALSEILRWVDENVQPGAGAPEAKGDHQPDRAVGPAPTSSSVATAGVGAPGGGRPPVTEQSAPTAPQPTGPGASGEITQMRPTGSMVGLGADASLPR